MRLPTRRSGTLSIADKATVFIRAETFLPGSFDVLAPDTALSREIAGIAEARAYAAQIAAQHGWRVRDQSGDPA